MLNRGLLTPTERVEAAIAAYENGEAPLNSVEGFVREIIGWREFITGVYWHRGPEYKMVNALGAERPRPAWLYTAETPMNCLHHVLRQNLELGWNHRIQWMMVLGNFMLIAGINPQEALRWFNEMYVDAYDWVMAANVLGMSLYADGGYMATKPYAATSNLHSQDEQLLRRLPLRSGPKKPVDACPFNYLYWDFGQHAERFGPNPRMRAIVGGWLKRTESNKDTVRESATQFLVPPYHRCAAPKRICSLKSKPRFSESQPSARVALSAPRTLRATCARAIGGRSCRPSETRSSASFHKAGCVAGNAASLCRRPTRRAPFA